MARDMADQAVAMLEAAGAVGVNALRDLHVGGTAIHEMGTARMGRDPRTSVLNAHNQCHDVPNLFVTDGSAMASSACQNPSLTYMALTARAAAFAAQELPRGLG
jgi:choline dehydrogenase-like flavoprotein